MEFKQQLLYLFFVLSLLSGCHQATSTDQTVTQFFLGRDDGQTLDRPTLYRASVPHDWKRIDPRFDESIADTTKAICEFNIIEGDQFIRLTIHTFPIFEDQMRISPEAQITRWKGQFDELDPIGTNTQKEAHGGFSGLFFEGEGILKDNPTTVIGWSMQLAPIYTRMLSQEKEVLSLSKRADYTIKASGSPSIMQKHKNEMIAFATSFELIEELPSPP